MSLVVGAWLLSETVAVGAVFATVAESDTVVPSAEPSFGVTSTLTTSFLSPLPAVARLKVSVSELEPAVVFLTTPFTFQT